MWVRALVVLVVTLVMVGSDMRVVRISALAATSHPVPAGIALRSSDLPGFVQVEGRELANAVVAQTDGESAAAVAKTGRLIGYRSRFLRDSGRGIVYVGDSVVEYQTVRDATREYRVGVAGDARFFGERHFKVLANPVTGTALVSYLCLCATYRETVDILDSHQGNYYFWIELHFVAGTARARLMAQQTRALAALIKSRISASTVVPTPSAIASIPAATPNLPALSSLSAPLYRIPCLYSQQPVARGDGIRDASHGVVACVSTRDQDGSSNFSGYLDSHGHSPPRGDIFLYAWVDEHNDAGQIHYVSSIRNFMAGGADGRTFAANHVTPYKEASQRLRTTSLDARASVNSGYVGFTVPAHDGPYEILWNEHGAISYTATAAFAVFPSP